MPASAKCQTRDEPASVLPEMILAEKKAKEKKEMDEEVRRGKTGNPAKQEKE